MKLFCLAGIFIFAFERWSLEDIIRTIFWARSAFLGLGLATIGALVRL